MNWEMGTKIAKLLLGVVAVYLGMKFIFPIVLPFFIALVLARCLYPLAQKIEQKTPLKRAAASSVAYGIFLVMIAAIVMGLLYFCYRMGSNCIQNLICFMESTKRMFGQYCNRLEQILGFGADEIQGMIKEQSNGFASEAMAYSKDAGWYMIGLFAKIFVTFVATLLILHDYDKIVGGLKGTPAGKRALEIIREMKTASKAYLRAQLVIIALVTAVCVTGLFIFRTPHALWIGIGIGICDALPFLGTGTVLIPWALIEVFSGEYKKAVCYLFLYLICSFIRQILEPRLVGQKLGLPPLAVLMSIYIGIQVYGTQGVILGPISALLIYELYRERG